jgi:alpha-tubulin suppressor-like RCC1 family protein
MMHGRKRFSIGPVAATLAAVAIFGGCRDATTGPANVESAAFASAIQMVSGNSQVAPEGATLSQVLTVKVIDAGGLPVEGANVTFVVRTGGGAIVPPTTVTNAAGSATATWTLGQSLGAQTAVAILSSEFVSDSASFSATATVGPAGSVTVVSGNSQVATVGKALALPLVVKVMDGFGNNVSGQKVSWVPGNLSGSVTPPSDTTASDGTAQATWTVGNTAATQTLTATVAGLTPIVFTASATADTAHVMLTIVSGASGTAAVSTKLATSLSVKITDEYGNPFVGDSVAWSGNIFGGGTVSPTSSATDATGTATTSWTLGGRAGPQSLQAKESKKALLANFAGTATVAFSTVFAGNFMACGIAASNNQTYCWGVGDGGQLGREGLTNASAPTTPVTTSDSLAGPFLQVRQVSGGDDGFCALTIDRRLFCWGRTIGVSSVTAAVATAQPIVTGSTNQQILPNFIAMGEEHVCLIDLTGLGFCTGVNLNGQLGTGNDSTPTIGTYPFINPSPAQGWSTLAAGAAHTCGMPRYNAGDITSQTPRCWGLNTTGQVGNNSTSPFSGTDTPSLITLPAGVTAFDSTSITGGAQHSCAIAAPLPGAAYCWGGNGLGQLGTGQSFATIDSVPTAVTGGLAFSRIYAGTYHSCGIASDGSAWCWGRDDYGQLGDGAPSAFGAGKASPVQVQGGLTFRSLSVGELYTCGVVGTVGTPTGPSASSGAIYCWGDNSFGQIGNGTAAPNAPVLTPTKVLYQP